MRVTSREICACAEMFPLGAQHNRPTPIIGVEVFERFGDPTDEVHGEKAVRRFCKFDDSNKVITDR